MTLLAEGLCYSLSSGQRLLSDISLELAGGQLLAVLGPNGAGKTTLLRLLASETEPSAGTIALNGRPLALFNDNERARRLAVLPQRTDVSFPYPVFDVAMFGRMPHYRTSNLRQDRRIVWECLERTESAHLAEQSFLTLSGGEKQRVQLARVFAQLEDGGEDLEGKVLLLDEPTSALDLAHQHQVLGLARETARRGAAVLAILHDLNLAAEYADELLVLHKGHPVAQGSPGEVFTPTLIEHVYRVRAKVHAHPIHGSPVVCVAGRCRNKESAPR